GLIVDLDGAEIYVRVVVEAETPQAAEDVQSALSALLQDLGQIRTWKPESYAWKLLGHYVFVSSLRPFAGRQEQLVAVRDRIASGWVVDGRIPDGEAIWERSDLNHSFSPLVTWIWIEYRTGTSPTLHAQHGRGFT